MLVLQWHSSCEQPLLIHPTSLFILADHLLITALFDFCLSLLIQTGQVFLNYFKSCEIFFWVLWEMVFKGVLFIRAAQILYSLLCSAQCCTCSWHRFLCLDRSICLDSVYNRWCDMPFSQSNSRFYVGFINSSLIVCKVVYFIPLLCSLRLEPVECVKVEFAACTVARTSCFCP